MPSGKFHLGNTHGGSFSSVATTDSAYNSGKEGGGGGGQAQKVQQGHLSLAGQEDLVADGSTKILMGFSLSAYNAVLNGDIECLRALYTENRAYVVDKHANTPLHLAAKVGRIKCLR